MLFPAGRENRILSQGDEAKSIFDKLTWDNFQPVEHPLNDEQALGMPLLHNRNVDITLQRRVYQPSIGGLYQPYFDEIRPIWSAIKNSSSIEEFQGKLSPLIKGINNKELAENYLKFQQAYYDLLTMLSDAPQGAYDEAARLLTEGSKNKLFMDFSHGNNISFDPEKQRFEFYDFDNFPNPVSPGSTIDKMVLGALSNTPYRDANEVLRMKFLLTEPKFQTDRHEKMSAIFEKMLAAEEKHNTNKAYHEATILDATEREQRFAEQQAVQKISKWKRLPIINLFFKERFNQLAISIINSVKINGNRMHQVF